MIFLKLNTIIPKLTEKEKKKEANKSDGRKLNVILNISLFQRIFSDRYFASLEELDKTSASKFFCNYFSL